MLEESAKGDFGSGEVGPRLKDIEWRWATDGTQREVLPESSQSTDRTERQCNQQ